MAREYHSRVHDYYLQMHELQPPAPNYHYELHQSDQSGAPAYQLTTGAGTGDGCVDGRVMVTAHGPPPPPPSSSPLASIAIHDHRKKKSRSDFNPEFDMTSCDAALPGPLASASTAANATRNRKTSSYASSNYDDDGTDDTRSTRSSLPDKKQNHSEIEKRRRDKMNTYITELSSMIPMCGAMARKMDKLTVLRMAVQHLRSIKGAITSYPLTARPRPAFLSERELNALILQAAHDCFIFVVGCDRGRLLYVSASVKRMLHYDKSELLGQSLFDILHPKDVAKVKEQLSASDLNPRERLVDIKTMLPVKSDVSVGASRLCPGARRSFFCRIKCKVTSEVAAVSPRPVAVKEEDETPAKIRKKHGEKKYCVVHCTGYLKSWTEGTGSNTECGEEGEACNLSCLVAVGRALNDLVPDSCPEAPSLTPTRGLQYVSRHATDGKFLFVDQRMTLALGFLPQELLGTSLYEYVSGPELGVVARAHKQSLLRREPMHTPAYSFRRKDGSFLRIQTHFKPFRNPWTKDVECLVANNMVVTSTDESPLQGSDQAYEMYKQKTDVEMQRLIDSQVESHKIGSAIADEAFRRFSTEFSPELPAEMLQETVFSQQSNQ